MITWRAEPDAPAGRRAWLRVMVLYAAANFFLGRLVEGYRVPLWWRVWSCCAIPLLVAVPAIVMTANEPVLAADNAAQITAATLAGLAVALMLGHMAARRPLGYMLLMADGLALACVLVSLAKVESVPGRLARGSTGFVFGLLALTAAGMALLAVTTLLYRWLRRHAEAPGAAALFAAGLGVAYLLLPLCHYLFAGDGGFRYISDAGNFCASNALAQAGVWAVVALLALGVVRLRKAVSGLARGGE